jgi:hypothetical protein
VAITFNGNTRVISLSAGTVALGVRDLWSRWVDWFLTSDNSKYPFAMVNLGGDVIDATSGTSVPIYVFLGNGWRIKPQEASHALNVTDGVLLVAGGGDPFVNTIGNFNVRINYSQPVQAITVATGGSISQDLTVDAIASGIWGASTVANNEAGSMGEKLNDAGSASNSWTEALEGSVTAGDMMRIITAVLAGNASGMDSNAVFKSLDGTKNRITATVVGDTRTITSRDAS